MGWLFSSWSRKQMIESDLIKPYHNEDQLVENRHAEVDMKPLAHCGGAFGRPLWVVWENKITFKDNGETRTTRWIACNLVQRMHGQWGYKDMSEGMGPYYYDCPLSYLDMVQDNPNQEWRNQVRQYHADRKPAFKLKVGQTVQIKNSPATDRVTITSIRPLKGVYMGRTWRIPKKMIGDLISESPCTTE